MLGDLASAFKTRVHVTRVKLKKKKKRHTHAVTVVFLMVGQFAVSDSLNVKLEFTEQDVGPICSLMRCLIVC